MRRESSTFPLLQAPPVFAYMETETGFTGKRLKQPPPPWKKKQNPPLKKGGRGDFFFLLASYLFLMAMQKIVIPAKPVLAQAGIRDPGSFVTP